MCMTRQTVLVLKYVLKEYPEQFLYYGYANVSQNIALMLSAIVLWISQSVSIDTHCTAFGESEALATYRTAPSQKLDSLTRTLY